MKPLDVGLLQSVAEQWFEPALSLLEQLVSINSWTRHADGVNAVGSVIADAFAPLGFAIEFRQAIPHRVVGGPDPGRHLILTRSGRSSVGQLVLTAHLDTVYRAEEEQATGFVCRRDGDRLIGPGVGDCKGGIALMWQMLSVMQQAAPQLLESVDWLILLNAGEEGMNTDFRALMRDYLDDRTLANLIFEPGMVTDGCMDMVVARKGSCKFHLQAFGRAAHAGAAHRDGVNAIQRIAELALELAGLTDYDRELTMNVSRIGGGEAFNRVPDHAWLEAEVRAFDPVVLQTVIDRIGRLADEPGPCRVTVEHFLRLSPWPANDWSSMLLGLWSEASSQIGYRIRGIHRGGLSDGNFSWDRVPTLDGLGPATVDMHCLPNSAQVGEYILVSSMVPKVVCHLLAIAAIADRHGVQ